jgi:hypothetical protein
MGMNHHAGSAPYQQTFQPIAPCFVPLRNPLVSKGLAALFPQKMLIASEEIDNVIPLSRSRRSDGKIGTIHGGYAMRKLLLGLALGMLVATTSGCILPAYSGDPARRTQELIYTSENLREFNDEWERFWFLDQPTHMTPYRTHGGII